MQLHEEELKTDDIMDRLVDDPEFKDMATRAYPLSSAFQLLDQSRAAQAD